MNIMFNIMFNIMINIMIQNTPPSKHIRQQIS